MTDDLYDEPETAEQANVVDKLRQVQAARAEAEDAYERLSTDVPAGLSGGSERDAALFRKLNEEKETAEENAAQLRGEELRLKQEVMRSPEYHDAIQAANSPNELDAVQRRFGTLSESDEPRQMISEAENDGIAAVSMVDQARGW